jgi:hypothetical protein
MTISSTTARNDYTALALQTIFPYTFKILVTSELAVYVNGVLKTESTHYTVSGATVAGGGNVTFVAPMVGGEVVAIVDVPELTQLTHYIQNDAFPSSTTENAFDKLTRIALYLYGRLQQSILMPIYSTVSGITLPLPSALKFLRWNAAATSIENIDIATLSAIAYTPFGASLIDDADSTAALTTLNVTPFVQTLLDDATSTAFLTTLIGSASTSQGDLYLNNFRLTLTSGVPVTTSDVVSATTLYCTPYNGNAIGLYSGSVWNIRASSEFQIALAALTVGRPYDVFCYDNAGTPTLEVLAWTNTTTRATALTTQDGVLVKTGATTRRYLGTFYTTAANMTEDSAAKRYLENYYNTVDRVLQGTFSADRSTASTSYVELNAEIQIKWVNGNIEKPVTLMVNGGAYTGSANVMTTAVAIDSTTVASASFESTATNVAGSTGQNICISNSICVAIGYHYATLLGMVNANTGVWKSATNNATGAKVYLTATKRG